MEKYNGRYLKTEVKLVQIRKNIINKNEYFYKGELSYDSSKNWGKKILNEWTRTANFLFDEIEDQGLNSRFCKI